MNYLLEQPQDTSKKQKKTSNSNIVKLKNQKTFKTVKEICDLNNIDIKFRITGEGKFLCVPHEDEQNKIKFKKVINTLKYSIDENINSQELKDIIKFIHENKLYSEDILYKRSANGINFENVKIGNNKIKLIRVLLGEGRQGGTNRDGHMDIVLPVGDPLEFFITFIHEYAHFKQIFNSKIDFKKYSVLSFLSKNKEDIENINLKVLFEKYKNYQKTNKTYKFNDFNNFLEIIAVLEKSHNISYNEDLKSIKINDAIVSKKEDPEKYEALYKTLEPETYAHIRDNIAKILMIEKIKFNEDKIKQYMNDKFYLYNKIVKEKFEKTDVYHQLKDSYDFRLSNNAIITIKKYLDQNESDEFDRQTFFKILNHIASLLNKPNASPPEEMRKLFNNLGYALNNIFYKNPKLLLLGFMKIKDIIDNSDELTNNFKTYLDINQIVQMILMMSKSLKKANGDNNLYDVSYNMNNVKNVNINDFINQMLDQKTNDLTNEFIDELSNEYYESLKNHHPKFQNLNQKDDESTRFNIKVYIEKIYSKIYNQMKKEFDEIGTEDEINILKKMYGHIKQESLLRNYINLIMD